MSHKVRAVQPEDVAPLARIWHDGWHEAHAGHVPDALTRRRTLDRFHERMTNLAPHTRTAGPIGDPMGFATITPPEMNQLFVTEKARGSGLAAALLTDAENRLAACGVTRAHLLCVIENARAAAFYEKCGWSNMGVFEEAIDTHAGPIAFDVLRFEKNLGPFG